MRGVIANVSELDSLSSKSFGLVKFTVDSVISRAIIRVPTTVFILLHLGDSDGPHILV